MVRLPPKPEYYKTAELSVPEGKKIIAKILKEKRFTQSDMPQKFFVIQELEFEHRKKHQREIRIGYWIIGKKGIAKGKWWWGQSCPLLPKKDTKKLIEILRKDFIR